tara:strand:- start:69 stop:353 length:285 start_codon:yes stop_codon:yes gene_type:complete
MSIYTSKMVDGLVVALSADEIAELERRDVAYLAGADDRLAADARDKRNDLLAATDWTANSDVTMTTEMTAYRTLLRNLPAQADFPTTITWPTEP